MCSQIRVKVRNCYFCKMQTVEISAKISVGAFDKSVGISVKITVEINMGAFNVSHVYFDAYFQAYFEAASFLFKFKIFAISCAPPTFQI